MVSVPTLQRPGGEASDGASPDEPSQAGRGANTGRSGRGSQAERDFEPLPDAVPPQNLEAEEAVLGGILLDPDAIGRVADVLQPEAFYLGAHREIFRTALMLHSQIGRAHV